MSDPSIPYRPFALAASPRRRLLLAGLFILLSIGAMNVVARALNMESSRNQLHAWALDPGHGWADSWDPMIAALDWLQTPHEGKLYQAIFFEQQIKFQYPPTSLLPLAAMRAVGVPLSPDLLNVIGWAWIVVTALAMAGFAVVLAERSGIAGKGDMLTRAAVGGMAIVATLTFYPIMLAYTIGQVQTWINALFIFACLAFVLERRGLAGALIGAICLLKPQFGLFVIWGVLRRDWPLLLGWVVVFVPASVLSLALFGVANNLDYLSVLQFLSSHGENYFHNQSVNGLLNRALFLGDSLVVPPVFPPYQPLVYYGTLLTSFALVVGALFLRDRDDDKGGLLDFMTAALTFTIASPIAWEYHYGILPPILAALLFALALQPRQARPILWLGLALAYLFTGNFLPITNELAESHLNFLQSYLLFAGLLTLWLLYRIRTPQSLRG
ncbi:MAG TPA: glycosyltransferase family 87 protein [Stellaceae bacterium]|nr:glycosyltransferase family 87 protein [Stellaceae bacterium]